MKVIVASRNPVKLGAVEDAFAVVLPRATIDYQALEVPSGVAEQPRSDEETRRGARNRLRAARRARPVADYWVGLEGGLEHLDERWLASAWMAIENVHGRVGEARTPTLPLPPSVQALLDRGLELGEANDRVFATRNSKQAGGAFGLLTSGRLTRRAVYAQTLELALLPLVHELWSEG
jgi:inosine/xanthosine triphosphatase